VHGRTRQVVAGSHEVVGGSYEVVGGCQGVSVDSSARSTDRYRVRIQGTDAPRATLRVVCPCHVPETGVRTPWCTCAARRKTGVRFPHSAGWVGLQPFGRGLLLLASGGGRMACCGPPPSVFE
jgi:hypothetical protein